jgi:DNA ligase (NAD+)
LVIPKLVEVLAPAKTPLAVTHCPSCGTEAVEEGEHEITASSIMLHKHKPLN